MLILRQKQIIIIINIYMKKWLNTKRRESWACPRQEEEGALLDRQPSDYDHDDDDGDYNDYLWSHFSKYWKISFVRIVFTTIISWRGWCLYLGRVVRSFTQDQLFLHVWREIGRFNIRLTGLKENEWLVARKENDWLIRKWEDDWLATVEAMTVGIPEI